jgi:C4-dicarboxylate transporter, DctM subunit
MTVAGLLLLIAALVVLRQSIVIIVALSVAYVHAFMTSKNDVEFLIQDVWYAVDREVLLSIPLFVFAGLIMARGSIAARLVAIMKAFTGPIPGGLGIATVLALTVFSAVCGASSVTMLAIGTLMYPALLQAGYPKRFALGLLCAGGTLGVIVPPSLLLILYGIATEVSITDLFKAGWGPGLMLAGSLCVYTWLVNRDRPTESFAGGELVRALKGGIWALLMPVILLGGIYTGWFTVTESAAVAVVYALGVELFIHRELRARDLSAIVLETVKMLGMLMPLLAIAASLNAILDLQGAPQALVKTMQAWVDSPAMLLVIVNLVLLVAGALMDESSAILILAPLLAPMGQAYGFDPVHFGIIVTVNLQIGYVAPPVALNLVVAMAAFKEPFGLIVRSVIPFILIMLCVLVVVCAWPQLSLFMLKR